MTYDCAYTDNTDLFYYLIEYKFIFNFKIITNKRRLLEININNVLGSIHLLIIIVFNFIF